MNAIRTFLSEYLHQRRNGCSVRSAFVIARGVAFYGLPF